MIAMKPTPRLTRLAPVVLLLAVIASGCAKKKPAPAPASLPEESVHAGMVPPADASGTPSSAPRVAGDPLSGSLDEVNAYIHEKGLLGDVFFDFDSPRIKTESVPRLRQNATFMREHPEFVFTIEGHCDERDTIEYNLALGQRRAETTQSYLSDLEVGKERMQTISYGKERPVCETPSENCWSQNRRAHFVIAERRTVNAQR